MSKSIRFNNNIYLDSSSVMHKTENNKYYNLKTVLNKIYRKSYAYDYDAVNKKTFVLDGFGTYLVTSSNVGNSNIYGYAIWIVFCGEKSSNTGLVRKIYADSGYTATLTNGNTLQIDYPSIYHTTTITKLNIQ